MIHGVVAGVAAIALGAVAFRIRPAEADHLSALVRPAAIILAIPAVWFLIQAIPIPGSGLANPMWASASTALGTPIMGRISIDPGATLLSLIRYFSFIAIGLTATAVSIDRRRAEWILVWLIGVTSVTAGLLVVNNLGFIRLPVTGDDITLSAPIAAVSVLGTIVAACTAIRAVERYETRRTSKEMTFARFARAFALCLVGLAICWLALSGRSAQLFAAACGTVALVLIQVIRRLGLGRWTSAALAVAAIIVASAVALNQQNNVHDLTLRFAKGAPTATVSVAQRIMTDASWAGSGAGTFSSLLPIYRDIDETAVYTVPTTAAAIAIELGRPLLLIGALTMIGAIVLLVRGALRRGRDSFYPAAGACCAIALTIEAFTDATALSTAPQIVAAAILGLALAQSVSRTSQ